MLVYLFVRSIYAKTHTLHGPGPGPRPGGLPGHLIRNCLYELIGNISIYGYPGNPCSEFFLLVEINFLNFRTIFVHNSAILDKVRTNSVHTSYIRPGPGPWPYVRSVYGICTEFVKYLWCLRHMRSHENSHTISCQLADRFYTICKSSYTNHLETVLIRFANNFQHSSKHFPHHWQTMSKQFATHPQIICK